MAPSLNPRFLKYLRISSFYRVDIFKVLLIFLFKTWSRDLCLSNYYLIAKQKDSELDFFGDSSGGAEIYINEEVTVAAPKPAMASKDNLLDGGVDNLQFFDAPKPQASKAPIQNTNNDLDDIFGGGGPTQNSSNNMQTNIGFGQPQANIGFGQSQANMYGGSPAQAQTKSMFASDATDIFNTAPVNMMNQNYYGGTQGYGTYNQGYGMYNQNYGAEAQNYGMEGQGYGMQYSGMYNTGSKSN